MQSSAGAPRRQRFAARLAMIGCAATTLLLTGCAEKKHPDGLADVSRSGQPIELSLYTMQLKPMYIGYMQEVLGGFERAHPGTHVKWLDQPAQEYETKLQSLIMDGKGPDVQNLPLEFMLHLHDSRLLLDLDDRVSSDVKSEYVDAILKSGCSIDGKLYALPWYLAAHLLMYNKDIFKAAGLDPEKPPATEDEFFAMCRQIKQRTGKYGFLATFTEGGQLKTILASEGIPLIDASGKKAIFNTPGAQRIVAEYKKLFDEGVVPRESVTAEHRRAIDLYKSGAAAFLFSGPQFLLQIKGEAPEIYKVTGVGQSFPVKGTNKFDIDTQNLAIFAKTPHPKEAIELAHWVTNGENQLKFAKLVTIFPSVKSALADPYFAAPGNAPEDKARNLGSKQIESATVLLSPLPHMAELNRVMNTTMQRILLENVPPAVALGDAEKQWTEILSRQ